MNSSLIVLFYFLHTIFAFKLGFFPNYYQKGDKVELLVNKVESDKTQLPYGYYDLPFVCPVDKNLKPIHLSLGEVLRGDRISPSSYDLKFGVDMPCKRLCDLIAKETGMKKADSLIKNGYVVHWLLDELPGATTFVSGNKNKYYAAGFPLGFVEDNVSYIYNHVMLVIRYHKDRTNRNLNTIVGFEVYPKSVSNEKCPGSSKDYENFAITFKKNEKGEILKSKTTIPYTYSVYWREDNSIDYDSRWDLYYENESNKSNHQIHWISFINSIVLLFLLTLFVAVVLMRVLKKDIQATSPILPSTDFESNNSWKNLANDVIKSPKSPLALTILVASGIQALVSTIGVILVFVINTRFSMVKSLSSRTFFNNHQGAFFSFSLFCLIGSGSISSYFGIILHKFFENHYLNHEYNSKKNLILSILFSGFLPGLILSVILFLNFFVWAEKSSNALPFGTIIVLILLFFVFELPLGIVGGYFGNKKKFDPKSFSLTTSDKNIKNDNENRKNFIRIKRPPWFLHPLASVLVFGMVPFGVVYVELLFIFNSVWLEKTTFYYMYGFLLLSSLILIIIIAESSVVAIYISLSVYNNPDWHWLCFRVGSGIGWFIYGYSIYYFVFYLNVKDFVSILFYFTYMALVCGLVGIACGAVGVVTGLLFIKKIYGTVKAD